MCVTLDLYKDEFMNKFNKGEILEPVLILIGLLVVLFLYILPIGPRANNPIVRTGGGSAWGSSSSNRGGSTAGSKDSLYERYVSLGSGNARDEFQPYSEYVTAENGGDTPVTMTGWFLTNDKGNKPYTINDQIQYTPSDRATIPLGTTNLSINNKSILVPIVLGPRERAIITTGSINPNSKGAIPSFKLNKCTGYLEKDLGFTLKPSLSKNCVRPEKEPGFEYLDDDCQEFIEGMGSCHIPDFGTRDISGESCRNCVDGKPGLSKSCVSYLESHYNYQGCVFNHQNDPDFQGKEWRIFLGKSWEMWAAKRETITLFDQFGKTIDYLSY